MSVQKAIKKVTVTTLKNMVINHDKISCLTAYDYTSAKLIDEAGIDLILVGDSLGMVMNGYDSTIPVSLDEVIYHTKSVVRGVKRAFVVADMPFGTYQVSEEKAFENIIKVLKETGASAVKMEGGKELAPLIKKLTSAGVAVMGHIGLMPQHINTLGGYVISSDYDTLLEDIKALNDAGVFSIVFEGIVEEYAHKLLISSKTQLRYSLNERPITIGIGASSSCDGQILVYHDIFGLFTDFKPKFVKRYAEIGKIVKKAASCYIKDIKNGQFPDKEHTYALKK